VESKGCREDESSRSQESGIESRAGPDDGGRLEERNHERIQECRKSYRASDLPFESRAMGRRAWSRMIGPIIGDCLSEDTQLGHNSRHVSGNDGERASCKMMSHYCRCGRRIVRASGGSIRQGAQDPGYRYRTRG